MQPELCMNVVNGIISTLKVKHSSIFYFFFTCFFSLGIISPFKPCLCFSNAGWKMRRWRKVAQSCYTVSWQNPMHPWSGGKEIGCCSQVTSMRSGKRGHVLSSSSMMLRHRMLAIIHATRGISRPLHHCKSKVGETLLEGREVTAVAALDWGDMEVLSLDYH